MVAQELKMNPQEIRTWSLKDLLDIVADILNKNDSEAFAYYFPET